MLLSKKFSYSLLVSYNETNTLFRRNAENFNVKGGEMELEAFPPQLGRTAAIFVAYYFVTN